jgi:hypothetical protein
MVRLPSMIENLARKLAIKRQGSVTPSDQQAISVIGALFSIRAILFILGGAFVSIVVLGMAFEMIFTGAVGLLASLAPFFRWPYMVLMRIAKPAGGIPPFLPPRLGPGLVFHLFLRLVAFVVWLGGGLYLLLYMGLCGQNLVCLVITSSRAP